MAYYLLELRESFPNENETISKYYIEAEDRQMVKYWYHFNLKDSGYAQPAWATNKHVLSLWDSGHVCEIENIEELSGQAAYYLDKYLPEWWSGKGKKK